MTTLMLGFAVIAASYLIGAETLVAVRIRVLISLVIGAGIGLAYSALPALHDGRDSGVAVRSGQRLQQADAVAGNILRKRPGGRHSGPAHRQRRRLGDAVRGHFPRHDGLGGRCRSAVLSLGRVHPQVASTIGAHCRHNPSTQSLWPGASPSRKHHRCALPTQPKYPISLVNDACGYGPDQHKRKTLRLTVVDFA
jgi:hypothetical protein